VDSEQARAGMLAAVARGDGEPTPAMYDPRLDRAKTEAALAGAAKLIDLTYDVPYLAHATMEVMNALAVVEPGRAELWLSTQSPLDTQKGVARALGLRQEQVVIHPERAGGGFGRRLEHAFAIEAARRRRPRAHCLGCRWHACRPARRPGQSKPLGTHAHRNATR
jgi:isoquinoline 1-oxidoreductase beta subunit